MNNLKQFIAHKAYKMRVSSVLSTTEAGSGHPTSALSAADIVAVLFFHTMRFDPHNPENPDNDRFILSKGHAAPVLYAVWHELGIVSEQELRALRKIDSPLEGHPTPKFSRSEAATGSLGQGLSIGLGMSLSARLDSRDFRTYVLMGDSEVSEGQIWEAAELAAYYKTDNLVGIVDVNRLGQTGQTMEGYDLERYARKFEAFGWHAIIVDGHTIDEIIQALDEAATIQGRPTVIIAKTVKGYGVDFVEDKNGFHGKAFSKEELPRALASLQEKFSESSAYEEMEEWKPNLPTPKTITPHELQKMDTQHEDMRMSPPNYTLGDTVPTRVAYGDALAALGNVDKAVVSLDGEVKNSTYAKLFEEAHPKRFFECFIAEQNMVGMGVGMAARGKVPYISTFACFLTRAHDQIRMAAIGRSTIRLAGSHAGVSIGEDGPSQMGLEDIAMLRAVPESIVLYPSDAVSTWKLVELMAQYNKGISYIRTTRGATSVIYENSEEFIVGGSKVLRSEPEGNVACVIAAGITVSEALKAHDLLKGEGIHIAVMDLYSIKPLDEATVYDMAQKSNNHIITVEDHYLEGGLGEAVTYAVRNHGITIDCLAVTKMPSSGSPEALMAYEGIDAEAIVAAVKKQAQ